MHAAALALAALAVPASALIARGPNDPPANVHNPNRQLLKRAITADVKTVNGKAFDFVIAGGGVAGLALASRLAEWRNVTVCVIEAGGDGSDVRDNIDVPGKQASDRAEASRDLHRGSAHLGTRSAPQSVICAI